METAEIVTNSEQETKKLAGNFAKKLTAGDVVALFGNLGSGKTTFVQGLAAGLGIKKRILSPSFVFIRQYPIPDREFVNLYHVDLYRIENNKNVRGLGLEEIFKNKNNIVVIEWADRAKKILPKKRIEIKFSYGEKENQRRIEINRRD